MLHLTKEKKYLLTDHIHYIIKRFPPKEACLSAVAVAMSLVDLPDNHKILYMEPSIEQVDMLVDLANTWLKENRDT